MNYSDKHISDFIAYLNYSVKNGGMDESVANDIIRRKAWDEVKELIDLGDELANDNEREEIEND